MRNAYRIVPTSDVKSIAGQDGAISLAAHVILTEGYHGCATGKAKQSAKTEIEKLKLGTMTCKDLVKEAAKIIYLVHDELKDKNFELELSWVCKDSDGFHEKVPANVFAEAEKAAKQAMEADSESDTEDM